LPRERVELVLDRDSYFLELCPLAGKDVSRPHPGAGLIGGIGRVSGVECLITASESTVKGGAVSEMTAWKSGRLSDIAEHNRLPSISMIESAGADLPNQSKIFVVGGRGFRDLTRRSQVADPDDLPGVRQLDGGRRVHPGMSDYVVMVEDQAQVYLAGPPLVKMATGEDTDHEGSGGARCTRGSPVSRTTSRATSTTRSGSAARSSRTSNGARPRSRCRARSSRRATIRPSCSASHRRTQGAVRSARGHRPDRRRLAVLRVQAAVRHDAGVRLGPPARLSDGILANNGIPVLRERAEGRAVHRAVQSEAIVPLVFLQNITGFMVGKEVRAGGIIKHGAKLINAVSNSTVPAITIMTGRELRRRQLRDVRPAYAPRFLFTWPNHRIAVMGGKQLAGVLDIIQREAAAKRGEPVESRSSADEGDDREHDREGERSVLRTARLWTMASSIRAIPAR